jgi:uncharacterized membrane protein YqhA
MEETFGLYWFGLGVFIIICLCVIFEHWEHTRLVLAALGAIGILIIALPLYMLVTIYEVIHGFFCPGRYKKYH